MGFRTLIEISHDSFSRIDKDAFHADLTRYVSSGDRDQAQRIEDEHDVRIISMRNSGERYYVSEKADGFPTRLPYDEELDQQNREWTAAVERARGLLGGSIRIRTIAGLRDIIVKLLRITTV